MAFTRRMYPNLLALVWSYRQDTAQPLEEQDENNTAKGQEGRGEEDAFFLFLSSPIRSGIQRLCLRSRAISWRCSLAPCGEGWGESSSASRSTHQMVISSVARNLHFSSVILAHAGIQALYPRYV